MISSITLFLAVALSVPIQPVAERPNDMRLDKMVIGGQLSAAQYENWQARKQAFEECSECFDQPFPDDE